MPLLDHHLPPPSLFGLFGRPQTPASPHGQPRFCGRRPPESRPDRLFLHVRSVSADGFAHLFQFALVDDGGNVAASVFAHGRSPVISGEADDADDAPPIPAVWWEELDAALGCCRGAWIIAFGRVLHGSFLPSATRESAAGLDCARARFMKVARRRGLRPAPGDILDLNDARRLVGLPPVRSPDAALRALGLRELWRWMDGVDGECADLSPASPHPRTGG